jgi:hypothetical protein
MNKWMKGGFFALAISSLDILIMIIMLSLGGGTIINRIKYIIVFLGLIFFGGVLLAGIYHKLFSQKREYWLRATLNGIVVGVILHQLFILIPFLSEIGCMGESMCGFGTFLSFLLLPVFMIVFGIIGFIVGKIKGRVRG